MDIISNPTFAQYPLVLLVLALTFYWFSKIEKLQSKFEDLQLKTIEAINNNTTALHELLIILKK
jgi:hypothetical protein